ncbi:hypothetical protein FYJ27_05395 [Anaerosalibacter bizertensis]|uniref:Phage tail assembly protein n=1 Tax=Anaerosalibacter bizertensis TaxID=932217 RepID=A0A844FGR2_9FIRM|nr:hypothetical protein [Anaerosalibacter bizertensis]MSS43166.1 hypothetical protein [Anaerosalibacter bizertensis]
MVNVEVREFKFKIGKKEYTFRLDFNALIKLENKYEDGILLFNNFLQGKNVYDCIVKILSCACVERDLDEEYIKKNLPFNFNTMKDLDKITFALAEGLINESDGGNEKN